MGIMDNERANWPPRRALQLEHITDISQSTKDIKTVLNRYYDTEWQAGSVEQLRFRAALC